MKARISRTGLTVALVVLLIAGCIVVVHTSLNTVRRLNLVAYFDNSNGIFPGDDVVILGVPVGKVDTIEPQPTRAKVTFWVDKEYQVPADAKAVILSPQVVSARAIQLTPAYTSGPVLADGAVIGQDRTAVPMEWDDFRIQLERLSASLQPTVPEGASPLASFINTTAENLRGRGAGIRTMLLELSQSISALGDHSGDIFSSVKNLSTLASALHDSADLMRQLNENLSAVTSLVSQDHGVGQMFSDVDDVAADLSSFIGDNREAIGTASDKLASVSQALVESLDDVKQTLHVAPNAFQNFLNIYEPAHGSVTGALVLNNFSNPISFICGAIQAASRLGAEQSAKLCVQYLAPIVKNRQYNFPPLGANLLVNAQARPNEVTYSEDWMRPDHVPQPTAPVPPPSAVPEATDSAVSPSPPGPPLPAEAPVPGGPPNNLRDLMSPPGAGQ